MEWKNVLEEDNPTTLDTLVDRLQNLDRKVFELATLLKAGQAMSNILDPDHLYSVYLGIVREKLEADCVALYIYSESGKTFELAGMLGLECIPEKFNCREGLIWQNISQDDPFPVVDISGRTLYGEFFQTNDLDKLKSDLWVPLIRLGSVIGLLTVGRKRNPFYNADETTFLKRISTQASHSINTCRIYQSSAQEKEALDKTVRNLSLLYDINKAMTFIHDLKNLLRYILKQALDITKAEKGSIMLYDPEDGRLHIRVIEGIKDLDFLEKVNNQEIKTQSFKPGEGIAGEVFLSGKSVFSNNTIDDQRFVKSGKSFVKSIACVPMTVFGDIIGVINVTNKQNDDGFTKDDEELLKAVADQAAVAVNKAQLWEMAVTDSLTALYIRRFFLAKVNEEMRRSERYKRPFSIIMCDIDHFKAVNDNFGHAAGDTVLKAVATKFIKTVRQTDVAARYGGEEFVLLLPETDKEDAALLANRLREAIAELTFEDMPGITISMGVSAYPKDGEDVDGLIRMADNALYKAKTTGRNKVVEYDPSIPGTPKNMTAE